jgi:hypothetical protein
VWRREKTAYETPDQQWLRIPSIAGAVAEARRVLAAEGILSTAKGNTFSPWYVLSLGVLMTTYKLSG